MKAFLIYPYIHTMLHKIMHVIKDTVRSKRNITMGRNHNLYLYASLDGIAQGPFQCIVKSKIRIYQFYAVLGLIDGISIELAYNLIRHTRFAVYNAYHLLSCRTTCIWLQSCDIVGTMITTIIFCTIHILPCHFIPHT